MRTLRARIRRCGGRTSVSGLIKYLVLALVVFWGVLCPGAAAAGDRFRLSHVWRPDSVVDRLANIFARTVLETTGDTEIEIYPASQLGQGRVQIEMLQTGQIDFVIDSYYAQELFPVLQVFDLPFLIRDTQHLRAVLEGGGTGEILNREIRDKGLVLVVPLYIGRRQISTNSRMIERPSDLEGLKIRTPNNRWLIRSLEEYFGALPTPIAFSEVYTALQVGIIDAQESSLAAYRDFRLYEVQPNLSLTNHIYEVAFLLTSEDFLAAQPPEVQEAIQIAAEIALAESFELTSSYEQSIVDELRDEHGIWISESVEVEEFRDYGKGMFDGFASEVPDGWDALNFIIERGYAS